MDDHISNLRAARKELTRIGADSHALNIQFAESAFAIAHEEIAVLREAVDATTALSRSRDLNTGTEPSQSIYDRDKVRLLAALTALRRFDDG
jgi:hypothetical protein